MRATTGSTTGRLTLAALTLGLLALAHPWNAVRADGRGSDDRDDRLDNLCVIGLTDDTVMDQIVIQSPPGNGILVATGKLGVDADPRAGFDIYSRLVGGVAVANRAFASLIVDGKSGFYRIHPLTGRAVRLGTFDDTVVDIAIPLDQ
jgi:hypothetical protein